MNIDLTKYSDNGQTLCTLSTGERVIAQEIDPDNNLIYIIKGDNGLRASYARNEQPMDLYFHKSVHRTVITSGTE